MCIIINILLIVIFTIIHSVTDPTTPSSSSFLFTEAKEIVATHQWQQLGENDTLPAGLHIKIDLSTGEKWAKLPSEDDDDDDDVSETDANINGNVESSETTTNHASGRKSSSSSSSSSAVMIDGSGALTILDDNDNNKQRSDSVPNPDSSNSTQKINTDNAEENEDDEAKYLMMHRVMSKLPPEELERFGGLPALPSPAENYDDNNNNNTHSMQQLTAEQRQAFQNRMDELWTQRQMELKQAQETLADFPEMLKERIVTLTQYLEDVEGSLRIVLEKRHQEQQEQQEQERDDEENSDGKEETDLANDIVSALRDLEYLLSDVDNARDFHTLGGWSILVALLDEQMHHFIPSTSLEALGVHHAHAGDDEVMVLVDEVRALAALCIGTAVSNLGEFRSWALEDVSSVIASLYKRQKYEVERKRGEGDVVDTISALSLLISSFEDELSLRSHLMGEGSMAIPNVTNTTITTAVAAFINPSWSKARYQSHATYKLRAIYALGALLRGNPPAQQYFALHNGPEAIVRDALGTLSSVRGPSVLADAALTKLDYKFASKVLALGEDVVMDVLLHGDDYTAVTHETDQVPSSTSSSLGSEDGEREGRHTLTANQLVAAFTTERWCDLSLRMLFPPIDMLGRTSGIGIQEKAMRSVGALAPACSSRRGQLLGSTTMWGLEEVKRVRSEWNREGSDDGLDPRYRRELLDLADGVLEVLLQ